VLPLKESTRMSSANLLIASLSDNDRALLHPRLKSIELKQQTILYEPGGRVDAVYFPTSSIISLVVTLSSGEAIEAAMVGRDGVVGAAAALDGKVSISRAIVQIGGSGFVCEPDALKDVATRHPALLSLLIRHEQTVYAQAQQSAACNATHHVEARLARWLLRARDLVGDSALPFTQEFLAEMLGVGRPTVSLTAHTLQQAGLIRYKRGNIQITDLEGLKETACECYETIRKHYGVLLGTLPNK
jgi:CRP-like cAMP-binding protein